MLVRLSSLGAFSKIAEFWASLSKCALFKNLSKMTSISDINFSMYIYLVKLDIPILKI